MDVRNSTSLPTYTVGPLKVTLVGPLDVLSLGTKHYLMVKMLSKTQISLTDDQTLNFFFFFLLTSLLIYYKGN